MILKTVVEELFNAEARSGRRNAEKNPSHRMGEGGYRAKPLRPQLFLCASALK